MEITWLGHSCFRLKGKNTTVITDPCSPDSGYSLAQAVANIVTVSHAHPGHSYIQGIDGQPKTISHPGEYELSGVLIIGIPTFHDNEKGARLGKNNVFIIEIDDITICHLGDLGHALTSEQVSGIGNVDVLMVPVGGVSTINASAAAELVRSLEPKVVLPMHYKTQLLKAELEPVDRFLKEMGVNQAVPQPKLSITKSNLPLSLQVSLLQF